MTTDLCIDYRENDLLGFFQPVQVETIFYRSSKYHPLVMNLTVGDIVIGSDASGNPKEGALIVERKTVADFEASFLDGRYRDQRARLLTFCQERKANVAYVLVGDLEKMHRVQTKGALMKLLTRLQLHYKIPVFYTKTPQETADLAVTWLEQWRESADSFSMRTSEITLADTIHVSKKHNAENPKTFATACLVNCQGVSVKMAETLLENWKSWTEILAASVDDIANVKQGNGRKIGPVVAGRLYTILHSTW